MKFVNNKSILFMVLCMALFSMTAMAEQHIYKGKVEGMVCAFCTYNVGKKIAEFNGVDAATVNLDLKSGDVGFVSAVTIEKSELAKLFTETGFKLVSLEEVKSSKLSKLRFNPEAIISISFTANKLSQFEDILDALGTIAASEMTQLSVVAPKNMELDILKPIIAGRQRAIKVNFMAADSDVINIKLSTVLLEDDS